MNRRPGLLLALVLLTVAASADAWVTVLDRPTVDTGASLVASDARGNIVVAGRSDLSGDQGQLTVTKLSSNGPVEWATKVPDVLTLDPRSLALDPAGNAYVAGAVGGDDEDSFGPFTVLRFDAATGVERWRWTPHPHEGRADRVAVDPAGDLLAAGHYQIPDAGGGDLGIGLCVKLAADTGRERWRAERIDGASRGVAVRPDGDVITLDTDAVRRLRGATGAVVWSTAAAIAGDRVEVDAAGDAVVAGTHQVTKVSGEDGGIVWHAEPAGFDDTHPFHDVALDASGDVTLGGSIASADAGEFAVVRLAGRTGGERWRQVVPGDGRGAAGAVAVDRAGDVIGVGQLDGYPNGWRFQVLRLDGATGAVAWRREHPLPGAASDVVVDATGHAAVVGFLLPREPPIPASIVARLSRGGGGLGGPTRVLPRR